MNNNISNVIGALKFFQSKTGKAMAVCGYSTQPGIANLKENPGQRSFHFITANGKTGFFNKTGKFVCLQADGFAVVYDRFTGKFISGKAHDRVLTTFFSRQLYLFFLNFKMEKRVRKFTGNVFKHSAW